MMDRTGNGASGGHPSPEEQPGDDRAAFSALLEDSVEDLYEHAPCGFLSTLPDGTIAKINTTLLHWLGYARGDLVGRRTFSDLLTVGGRIYHETHFGPLLRMQGEISGIALELEAADGSRLPVLVTSTVKSGSDGQPMMIRTTAFDARDRRAYETELLRARQQAEDEREELMRLNATLQQTLLPPALVSVPGLDVAAHYHIASPDKVGGDFYDLFPLAAGTWGLFLGDVCGKGAAAAAVTSLARYTLRAAAVYDPDPAAVLTNLNTVLNHEYNGDDPRFCTVIFGLLTPDTEHGGFRITLAGGGHPRLCSCGRAEAWPTWTPPADSSSASCPTPTSPPPPSTSRRATPCCSTPTASPRPTRPRTATTTATGTRRSSTSPALSRPPPRPTPSPRSVSCSTPSAPASTTTRPSSPSACPGPEATAPESAHVPTARLRQRMRRPARGQAPTIAAPSARH